MDFDRDSVLDLVVSTQQLGSTGAADEIGLLVFVSTATTDPELFSREPAAFEPDDGSMFKAPVQVYDQSVVWMRAFSEGDQFDLAIAQLIGIYGWLRTVTFGPDGAAAVTITNIRANEFAFGDFDGDGDLDVVTLANERRVVWNTGQTLAAGPLLDFTPRIFETPYQDLNGDGMADLVEWVNSDRLIVRAGDGAGGFVPEQSVNGFDAIPIHAMDVDGDSHIDLVAVNGLYSRGGISIYYGDNVGQFLPPSSFDIPNRGGNSLAAVRLRGDTRTDFVVPTHSGVEILRGRPERRFTAPAQILGVASDLYRIAVGDLTGDGLPEIATCLRFKNGSAMGIFSNHGGRFTLSQRIEAPVLNDRVYIPVGMGFIDIDGDGDLDLACNTELATGAGNSGEVRVFLYANENGQFQYTDSFAVEFALSHADMRVVEFTGDGVPDLVLNLASPGTLALPQGVAVIPASEDGFSAPVATYASVPNWYARGFDHIADFNGDGLTDVLVGGPYHFATVPSVLFLGVGDGAFDEGHVLTFSFARPRGVIDANADGVLDIIAPTQAPSFLIETGFPPTWLSVTYGVGPTEYEPAVPFTKMDVRDFTCAAALDLNDDGVDEFLASGHSIGYPEVSHLSIFQADPQLSPIPSVQLRQSPFVAEAIAADVDGDGDLDLITHGYPAVTIHESTLADRAADLDSNGVVDSADLALLLSAWGTALLPQDLNQDGVVDGADLGHLLAQWGSP